MKMNVNAAADSTRTCKTNGTLASIAQGPFELTNAGVGGFKVDVDLELIT